jgi:hypothetical protein
MKIVRLLVLCLTAMLALGATIASSASAEELLFKATRGTVVGGGFTMLSGLMFLRTLGGSEVHCSHVDGHGKFTSTTLGEMLVLMLGCVTNVFGSLVKCHNSGTEDIHLPLATTLFHLGLAHDGSNTSIPAVDILLDQAVSFKCSIGTITMSGDLIGALEQPLGTEEPLNTPEKETQLVFKESSSGMALLTEFLMPGVGLVNQHLTLTVENGIGGKETIESAETSTYTLGNFTNSAGEATEIEITDEHSVSTGKLLFKATNGNVVGGEFTMLSGLTFLKTLGGSEIHCKHIDSHGKFTSTTLGEILILILGCTTNIFGSSVKCHNSGTEDIHFPLATTLFRLGLAHDGANTSIPAIDILLDQPAVIKCSIGTITMSGGAVGELEVPLGTQVPLNTPEKEVNLVYKEASAGMQLLTEFLMPGAGLVNQHLSWMVENGLGGKETIESAETLTSTLSNFTNSAGEATEVELVEP